MQIIDVRMTEALGGMAWGPLPAPVAPPYNQPGNGELLIGLIMWSAAWVDAVRPLFAVLNADGTLGATRAGARCGGPTNDDDLAHLRRTDISIPGYVVTGMRVYGGSYVDRLALKYTRWQSGLVTADSRWTQDFGGTGGEYRGELKCASNEVVVGLHGRAAMYFDTVGLYIGRLT